MKIALDLRWIRREQIDGISRYVIHLASHMLESDTENKYVLIGTQEVISKHIPVSTFPNITIVTIPQTLLSIKDFLLTHRELQRLGIDIFHSPNYLATPFKGPYKKLLTVQDVIPFLFPKALSKSRLLWKTFYQTPYPARLILHTADRIITTSENTKRDLIKLLHIPEEKISVVWIGLEERFYQHHQVSEQFYSRYQLPQQFLLYVGRQDPYKGLQYLVDAYALLPAALRQTYKVVIAGKTDPRYISDVHATVEQHGLQQDVIFLDYIPDDDLPRLYSAATLLIHPSLYEGFGLTPLEAMACGTPVVYADSSSLTELLGEAGLAVAPASSEALARGIHKLFKDEQLRQTLAQRGRRHARQYSWSQVAQQMIALYSEIGPESTRP